MTAMTDTGVTMFGGPSDGSSPTGYTGTPLPAQGGGVDVFDMPPACIQAP